MIYQKFYQYFIFAPILIYFFISKEFVGLRLLLNPSQHNALISFIMYFIIISYFIKYYFDRKNYLSKQSFHIKYSFNIILILWGAFTLSYGILFSTVSISTKYFLNILILLLIINYDIFDFNKIGKVFGIIILFLFLLIVFQAFLMKLFGPNSIANLDIIYAVQEKLFRTDSAYYNPYYMGFVRHAGLVEYGDFSFYRHLSYTTEPKYASALCIGLMISIIIYIKNYILVRALLFISIVSLLLIHSYAGLATFIIALGLLVFSNFIIKKPYILFFLFLSFNYLVAIFIQFILDNLSIPVFAIDRIYSFNRGSDLASFQINFESIFGTNRLQGTIGRFFEWLVFFWYYRISIFHMKYIYDNLSRFAILLGISSYYVFWLSGLLPELITPLLIFIIISTIFLIVNNQKNQQKVTLQL